MCLVDCSASTGLFRSYEQRKSKVKVLIHYAMGTVIVFLLCTCAPPAGPIGTAGWVFLPSSWRVWTGTGEEGRRSGHVSANLPAKRDCPRCREPGRGGVRVGAGRQAIWGRPAEAARARRCNTITPRSPTVLTGTTSRNRANGRPVTQSQAVPISSNGDQGAVEGPAGVPQPRHPRTGERRFWTCGADHDWPRRPTCCCKGWVGREEWDVVEVRRIWISTRHMTGGFPRRGQRRGHGGGRRSWR